MVLEARLGWQAGQLLHATPTARHGGGPQRATTSASSATSFGAQLLNLTGMFGKRDRGSLGKRTLGIRQTRSAVLANVKSRQSRGVNIKSRVSR